MNKFNVCDKCRGTNIKTLIPRLKKLDKNSTINIGCQSVCGIGKTKPFVICNDRLIVATTEEELIEKVKQAIKL